MAYSRIREDLPDTSLKASIADLLEALNQARQERDQALREIRKLQARITSLWAHLARARAMLARPPRRRQVKDSGQLALPLVDHVR